MTVRIDKQYLNAPWHGSRQMMRQLRREDWRVNRKRIRRLMHQMGLSATSPAPGPAPPRTCPLDVSV